MATRKKKRILTFAHAINEALVQSMKRDKSTFIIGLGVPDPKGVFGTTLGLQERFGANRVYDMPVSENAVTGVCVGAAISGMRPIMCHQRADFTLMGVDQIINNAAKWRYMFGGASGVPLTIRMIIGRGWGQGPQHSQNFQAMFANIPGLKVVTPTTPYEAKGLLSESIRSNDPVIFIEHRWLYGQVGDVPRRHYTLPFGKATTMRRGTDVTIVASMDAALEAVMVADKLRPLGLSVEVLSLPTVKPLDTGTILRSVRKTGRLLVIDSSWMHFGVSAEVAAVVANKGFKYLKKGVERLGLPDITAPTTPALSRKYYPSEADIGRALMRLTGKKPAIIKKAGLKKYVPDVFNDTFRGPF
jgi:pyruvate dehydrogenase E1 component beta subunit